MEWKIISNFALDLWHILKSGSKDALIRRYETVMAASIRKLNFYRSKKQTSVMSKTCQITGKKASVGNNVSHSKRRTKRRFNVNLHTKKFYWVEQDMWIELRVSARALRTINKIGLNAALKRAEAEGNLDFKNIQILSL